MINPIDALNVTPFTQGLFNQYPVWVAILAIIAIWFCMGIIYYFLKNKQKELAEKIPEYGCKKINKIAECLSSPIKQYRLRRSQEKEINLLKAQIRQLSDSEIKNRKAANQPIINYLFSRKNAEVAVKFKIQEILIPYLSSEYDDVQLYALDYISRIVEQTDKNTSVSTTLIKELVKKLSSDEKGIRESSLKLLRLLVYNNCDTLFISSIKGINDPLIVSSLIELLENILEQKCNEPQTQLSVYKILNEYLLSDNIEIQTKTLAILEKKITDRFSDEIIESGLISSLLTLFSSENDVVRTKSMTVLMIISKISLLPQIIQSARKKDGGLPKFEMSGLIQYAIPYNDFNQVMNIDILLEIFDYLAERNYQIRANASDSIVRLIYQSNEDPRRTERKKLLAQKLIDLHFNIELLKLLSDTDPDIKICGIQVIQATIRIKFQNQEQFINDEIIDSLIRCLFDSSEDVRRLSFRTVEQIIGIKNIVNKLCYLGLEEAWLDPVAKRFSEIIHRADDLLSMSDSVDIFFKVNLDPEMQDRIAPLKERIKEEMAKRGSV